MVSNLQAQTVKSMALAHGTVVTSGRTQATELLELYIVPSD